MKEISCAVLLLAGLCLAPVSLLAHHGTRISYDRENPITLVGRVSDLFWRNPHVAIFVDVTDESGEIVTWALEAGPLRNFARSGITRTMLESGKDVTVVAFPSRAGSPVGQLEEIRLSDGTSTPVEFD